MATKIIMPQLGESVVDGTVGEWLKQVGDTIEEYESIIRVSTDKVDTEIPSPASGVLLEIYVDEGETVDSGVVLGLIGEEGESVADDNDDSGATHSADGHKQHAETEPVGTGSVTGRGDRQKTAAGQSYTGHVTPVVARMVEQHDVDLSQIEGTGRNGRIRKKDVLAYLEAQDDTETASSRRSRQREDTPAPWEIPADGDLFKPTVNYEDDAPQAQNTAPPQDDRHIEHKPQPREKAPRPPRQPMKSAPVPQDIPGELVQMSNMRRSIAQHMVESKLHTSPHVTTVMEVDMSAVMAHRNAHKAKFAAQGVKLTFTPYFVAASARALLDVPSLNARWTEDGLYYQHVANIGMAVAIDDGLIVPVIANAQDYNLTGLARQVNDLADRARSRQLTPDEVRSGTFTITNHGVSGSIVATPIINQPQAAILGVGIIEKRVKVINDAIAIRPCCYLSLTFDHRIADGATADGFLMRIKQTLENWQ